MAFSTVLIANRGEIAVRLVHACAELGLKSVAVFSDADADAPHVRLADTAVHIGPAEARASYLDATRIIEAAHATGAQAIHPGYGFLAENAGFARACIEAGLEFVGPSPDVIAAMGLKIEAKRIATAAGVACVPGYHGDDQDDATLAREAERIGSPLLIKASAGGGGRGMRRIDDLGAFTEQLALARQEAGAAFGDSAVLLERYIEAPRHVEVQILADRHGNVRHLFERDCSIQRNYQKVIEEAPAPNLDPDLRARMLGDAVRLAEQIRYDNAGTVEFVVDANAGEAFFLEMNTRLQVEHPVTEAITGIDLAAWQLRIAGGEALSFPQSDVTCTGWAVEARVAAEDPADGYRPQTGRITVYTEPRAEGLRIDSGIGYDSEVTPYYDSMLAKIIATGPDRATAISTLRHGLAQYRIGGVGVNTGFLRDVLALDAFVSGRHQTSCLTRAWPAGWQTAPITDADIALAALTRHVCFEGGRGQSPWTSLGAWRLGEACGRPGAAVYCVSAGDTAFDTVTVRGRGGSYTLERGGETVLEVRQARWQDDGLVYRQHGQRHRLGASVDGDDVYLHRAGHNPAFTVSTIERVLLDEPGETGGVGNAVLAPTPGLIAEVLVAPGQAVAAGEPVIVLEAMKLLQQLCAPVSGTAGVVHCRSGDTVAGGDCLVTIEPASEPRKQS